MACLQDTKKYVQICFSVTYFAPDFSNFTNVVVAKNIHSPPMQGLFGVNSPLEVSASVDAFLLQF